MTATTLAGQSARTTTDAPNPQKHHATTCDQCGERPAAGMNPDGRSLCRPCADRSGILMPDGGHTESEFFEAKKWAEAVIRDHSDVDESACIVRGINGLVIVDTEQSQKLTPELTEKIERDAGLRLCAVEPLQTVRNGVRARFRLDEADETDNSRELDRLATQFERRREQAGIAAESYEDMGHDGLAQQYTGRAVGFADARAAIRHEQGGETDE